MFPITDISKGQVNSGFFRSIFLCAQKCVKILATKNSIDLSIICTLLDGLIIRFFTLQLLKILIDLYFY